MAAFSPTSSMITPVWREQRCVTLIALTVVPKLLQDNSLPLTTETGQTQIQFGTSHCLEKRSSSAQNGAMSGYKNHRTVESQPLNTNIHPTAQQCRVKGLQLGRESRVTSVWRSSSSLTICFHQFAFPSHDSEAKCTLTSYLQSAKDRWRVGGGSNLFYGNALLHCLYSMPLLLKSMHLLCSLVKWASK